MAACKGALCASSARRCGCTSTQDSPIPHEYCFLDLDGLERSLDLGSLEGLDAARRRLRQRAAAGARPRRGARALRRRGRHRPPPRQQPLRRRQPGRRQRVVDRRDPGHGVRPAGRRADAEIAEALYVGLVTDTGRFQYRTTSPAALRLARASGGARRRRAQGVSSWCSRRCRTRKKQLLGRVLEHAQPFARRPAAGQLRDPRRPGAGGGGRGDDRGPDRPPPRGRGRAGRRPDPRAGAAGRRDDHAQPGLAALPRGRSTCRRSPASRAAAGTSRRPASRIPASVEEIRDFIVAEVDEQLAESAA